MVYGGGGGEGRGVPLAVCYPAFQYGPAASPLNNYDRTWKGVKHIYGQGLQSDKLEGF